MPSPAAFSFSDLVRAWRGWRRWGSAHPDLVEFHRQRYAAFAAAFGTDLEHVPKPAPPMPEWVVERALEFRGDEGLRDEEDDWHVWVHRLALDVEKRSASLHGPFSGYLEAPIAVIAASGRFGPRVNERVASLRSALDEMLFELLTVLFPEEARRSVSGDELRAHGFDPDRREPDPDDYW